MIASRKNFYVLHPFISQLGVFQDNSTAWLFFIFINKASTIFN